LVRKFVLPNGITLVCERMPRVGTVSFGLWQRVGSAHEVPTTNGLTHFVEHMLFKGTPSMTARDIAIRMDSVGAVMNAFTTREKTCFYANVIASHAPMVIDLLRAMYYESNFPAKEIAREREVVMQEIRMYEDSPDDYIHDSFMEQLWPDHPVGYAVAGRIANIEAIRRAGVVKFFDENYVTDRLVVSAAGDIDPDKLAQTIGAWPARFSNRVFDESEPPHPAPTLFSQRKKLEQVHVLLGMPGVPKTHRWRFAIALLNQLWGGSMSSRLFQKIREQYGICYSIYTYPSMMHKTGYFGIYCATSEQHLDRVLSLIRRENDILLEKGVADDELARSKEQLKSSLLIGRESVESRMNLIAMQEIVFGRSESVREVLQRIDDVSREEMRELIDYVLGGHAYAARTLGPANALPLLNKYFSRRAQ